MFSNLSASSISLATVTPSLVIRGAPNDLSSTTLRPLGPRVTLTALARMSTPRSIRSRASPPKRTSFAAISVFLCCRIEIYFCFEWRLCRLLEGCPVFQNAHDVGFFHDQQLVAVDLDLAA